jgi:glyoxylase-like metal-dependent hydrolase (beta-lactamase superfamily II)/rhodanese-related sulfurtransferase
MRQAPIQLFDPVSSTYTYIIWDEDTREAVIIDPVDTLVERDMQVLSEQHLRLVWSVETHAHADHITSSGVLAEQLAARTAAPAGCGIGTAGMQLTHGDTLGFGQETLQALHTPGHTAGSMSFVWRNHVFTGDTLLINGCGRTDFQSGSAEQMYHSLTQVLFALPDDTTVWPGHDYKGNTHSTIGLEKRQNARVAGKTLAEFVQIMQALNLPKPQRIDEAVPANLTSGIRHAADDADALQLIDQQAKGYAGDVSPQLAYAWMQSGKAVLIDIRTDAERAWVGYIPGAPALEWKHWPGMAINPHFGDKLQAMVPPGSHVTLLCRSGIRSIAAAQCAQQLGYQAYNILEGFEGDPDNQSHRGRLGGWRFHGLPWKQG